MLHFKPIKFRPLHERRGLCPSLISLIDALSIQGTIIGPPQPAVATAVATVQPGDTAQAASTSQKSAVARSRLALFNSSARIAASVTQSLANMGIKSGDLLSVIATLSDEENLQVNFRSD
jgi:hypothetical protein